MDNRMREERDGYIVRVARWMSEGRQLIAEGEGKLYMLKLTEASLRKSLREARAMLGKDDELLPAIAEKDC